ncbi:holo-ACP synthase [Rarobacter faecitabidus]|uniref:Holo-[acyl-carrier-protein] synthase n=1 Tax=Rarobacter faecitabidus TaxID=13243 RepID=A0A542ZXH3_RARFA|nr:holo-ACP synthase [Rarobacter faecitabidus]TQL65052.1 holo-[acyl-carrier protein] synthase [Rarobacter faecitabidus]
MIIGIGTDIVDEVRLGRALARAPRLRSRIFTEDESSLPLRSLAGRFAAKEAVAKALGSPGDLSWLDVEVVANDAGAPSLVITGRCAERAKALGIAGWHVSISHDAGVAVAFVIAEARDA